MSEIERRLDAIEERLEAIEDCLADNRLATWSQTGDLITNDSMRSAVDNLEAPVKSLQASVNGGPQSMGLLERMQSVENTLMEMSAKG